jgi:hypothetical protein
MNEELKRAILQRCKESEGGGKLKENGIPLKDTN